MVLLDYIKFQQQNQNTSTMHREYLSNIYKFTPNVQIMLTTLLGQNDKAGYKVSAGTPGTW